MTTIEASRELAREYSLPLEEFSCLADTYDGLTPTEREITTDELESARNASSYDEKTLAAAMFHVSKEVELHFYFDLQEKQIGFGD